MKDTPFYYSVYIERCVFFLMDPFKMGKISIQVWRYSAKPWCAPSEMGNYFTRVFSDLTALNRKFHLKQRSSFSPQPYCSENTLSVGGVIHFLPYIVFRWYLVFEQ